MSEIASLILQYYDALRANDWERLKAFYDPDVQYSDPEAALSSRGDVIARTQALEAPFSSVVLTIQHQHQADRSCAVEWLYEATNHQPWRTPSGDEAPASGRRVSVRGVSVFQFREGRIVAERSYWDNMALYHQLGLLADPQLLGAWT